MTKYNEKQKKLRIIFGINTQLEENKEKEEERLVGFSFKEDK